MSSEKKELVEVKVEPEVKGDQDDSKPVTNKFEQVVAPKVDPVEQVIKAVEQTTIKVDHVGIEVQESKTSEVDAIQVESPKILVSVGEFFPDFGAVIYDNYYRKKECRLFGVSSFSYEFMKSMFVNGNYTIDDYTDFFEDLGRLYQILMSLEPLNPVKSPKDFEDGFINTSNSKIRYHSKTLSDFDKNLSEFKEGFKGDDSKHDYQTKVGALYRQVFAAPVVSFPPVGYPSGSQAQILANRRTAEGNQPRLLYIDVPSTLVFQPFYSLIGKASYRDFIDFENELRQILMLEEIPMRLQDNEFYYLDKLLPDPGWFNWYSYYYTVTEDYKKARFDEVYNKVLASKETLERIMSDKESVSEKNKALKNRQDVSQVLTCTVDLALSCLAKLIAFSIAGAGFKINFPPNTDLSRIKTKMAGIFLTAILGQNFQLNAMFDVASIPDLDARVLVDLQALFGAGAPNIADTATYRMRGGAMGRSAGNGAAFLINDKYLPLGYLGHFCTPGSVTHNILNLFFRFTESVARHQRQNNNVGMSTLYIDLANLLISSQVGGMTCGQNLGLLFDEAYARVYDLMVDPRYVAPIPNVGSVDYLTDIIILPEEVCSLLAFGNRLRIKGFLGALVKAVPDKTKLISSWFEQISKSRYEHSAVYDIQQLFQTSRYRFMLQNLIVDPESYKQELVDRSQIARPVPNIPSNAWELYFSDRAPTKIHFVSSEAVTWKSKTIHIPDTKVADDASFGTAIKIWIPTHDETADGHALSEPLTKSNIGEIDEGAGMSGLEDTCINVLFIHLKHLILHSGRTPEISAVNRYLKEYFSDLDFILRREAGDDVDLDEEVVLLDFHIPFFASEGDDFDLDLGPVVIPAVDEDSYETCLDHILYHYNNRRSTYYEKISYVTPLKAEITISN